MSVDGNVLGYSKCFSINAELKNAFAIDIQSKKTTYSAVCSFFLSDSYQIEKGFIAVFKAVKQIDRGSRPTNKNEVNTLRTHWTHCVTTVIRFPLVSKLLGALDEAIQAANINP